MSDTLHPPLRISTTSSVTISSKVERACLDVFLADYADRMATKGGDTTVTTQLHKLKAALADNMRPSEKSEYRCRFHAMSFAKLFCTSPRRSGHPSVDVLGGKLIAVNLEIMLQSKYQPLLRSKSSGPKLYGNNSPSVSSVTCSGASSVQFPWTRKMGMLNAQNSRMTCLQIPHGDTGPWMSLLKF